jgi:hypothetical protein
MDLVQYEVVSAQAFTMQHHFTLPEWNALSVTDQRDFITCLAIDEEVALDTGRFNSSYETVLKSLNKCTHLDSICDSCDELCKAEYDEDFNEFCPECLASAV